MIASLLPGLRELRAPLAAGYIWLAFAYLTVGAPTEVADAPGPLRELLTVLPTMGTAATVVAVSFVAYLIGSLSQDLFDRVLPSLLERLSKRLPESSPEPYGPEIYRPEIKKHLEDARVAAAALEKIQEEVPEEVRGEDHDREEERQHSRKDIRAELDRLLPMLDELSTADLDEQQAAGLSEAEKPEAHRPMMEAEVKLRTAIVPPLAAVMTYLTVAESVIWAIGLMFVAALLVQAVTRQMAARRLRDQRYRARGVAEIQTELEQVARGLSVGEGISAWRLGVTLRQLTDRLYPPARS